MKKTILLIAIIAMLVSSAIATETILNPETVKMGLQDTKTVKFCLYQDSQPQDVYVKLGNFCYDKDGLLGCSKEDVIYPDGFIVYPESYQTGKDGCVDIILMTDVEESGIYYYTVNGQVAGTTVGTETGKVILDVPEFGVLASLVILAGTGAYIGIKRRK